MWGTRMLNVLIVGHNNGWHLVLNPDSHSTR